MSHSKVFPVTTMSCCLLPDVYLWLLTFVLVYYWVMRFKRNNKNPIIVIVLCSDMRYNIDPFVMFYCPTLLDHISKRDFDFR